MKGKHYTHILWDFNGTILDDVAAGIQSENVLLGRRGMPLLESVEQYHALFCFPIKHYYEKLGHDFTRERYEDLAVEWMAQYAVFSEKSPLCPGVREAAAYFRGAGMKQVILSASEETILRRQLHALNAEGWFDEIVGMDNINAYGKTEIALAWKARENPASCLFLGDTEHDYEVACALGADCILIAHGHQSASTLARCGVPVYDTLETMRRELFE